MTDPHPDHPVDDDGRPRISRRRFTRLAAGMVAGVAGVLARPGAAGAASAPVKVGCCNLKYPSDSDCGNKCARIGEKTRYRMRVWNCTLTRTVTYACYECCYGGSTCYNATNYYCSRAVRMD